MSDPRAPTPGNASRWRAHWSCVAGWIAIFLAVSVAQGVWRTGSNSLGSINQTIVVASLVVYFTMIAILTTLVTAVWRRATPRAIVVMHALIAAAIAFPFFFVAVSR